MKYFKAAKNYILIFLVAISCISFCACKLIEKKENEYNLSVGLVLDDNKLENNYFNKLAIEGLNRINEELGIKTSLIKSQTKDDFRKNIEETQRKNTLTIVAGHGLLQSLDYVAKTKQDKDFCIIDGISQLPNVRSVTFRDEEGAFLMGVIAASVTKTGKVGYIGGIEKNSEEFVAGYIAGIKQINKELATELIDGKYIDFTNNYSNDDIGYETANKIYKQGVDVIFHSTGGAGDGIFRAAKENGKYAIGVDIDQAESEKQYEGTIISSMLKKVDVAVFEAGKQIKDSDFVPGPKNLSSLGLKEKGIEVAPSTKKYVSKEVMDKVDYYKSLIESKKIYVPTNMDELRGSKI